MKKNILIRYTSLPILLDILWKQELTLLNPSSWEDRNDSYYIELYKKKKRLKTVLALCFTTRPETFHHWKVFSDGASGVCIQFNKEKLLKYLDKHSGIESDYVLYRLIQDLKSDPPELDELPFLKRYPYKDDGEFRVIYKDKKKEVETKSISFGFECIEKITLSPWVPNPVVDTVKGAIKDIPGCSKILINKTTLIESTVWKNIATRKMAK